MPARVDELAEQLVRAFNSRDVDVLLAIVDEAIEFDFGAGTTGRRPNGS